MVNLRSFIRAGAGVGFGLLSAAALLNAQSLQSFVAITPCRAVDTRLPAGALGGPIMGAGSTRSFPIAGSCGLPSNASAYSLNVTVLPAASLKFLSLWPTGTTRPGVSTLNDFVATVLANAAIVESGTSGAISVYVTDSTNVVIDVNGYFLSNTNVSSNNTTVGQDALSLTAGSQNTAIGFGSLGNNISGNDNTSIGSTALSTNSTGSNNTAIGQAALGANTTGSGNTAIGYGTLVSEATAVNNVAIGNQSMNGATGDDNVAIGTSTLVGATGTGNIGIGYAAGISLGAGSNNIEIGNAGSSSDDSVIRIGTGGAQSAVFVAGINNVNVGASSAVFINSGGQLGTLQSSRRYKEDIHPMADASDALMQLEPVIFRYKQPATDGTKDIQYGLIAEQVADVYPELAVHNKDGLIETLQYQELPAMMLNEIQKQHKTIQDLETRLAAMEQLLKANTAAASTTAARR